MKSLNDMQKLFCCNYVKLGNVGEAAVKAGFSPETALMDGMECLENKACRRLISRLKKSCYSGSAEIISGLERLAFGSCNDAVYLVFSEELPPPQVISKLDLFNVSEIKRVKGGGVEVKLFDRQKALEKMLDFLNCSDNANGAESLLAALTSSAERDYNDN